MAGFMNHLALLMNFITNISIWRKSKLLPASLWTVTDCLWLSKQPITGDLMTPWGRDINCWELLSQTNCSVTNTILKAQIHPLFQLHLVTCSSICFDELLSTYKSKESTCRMDNSRMHSPPNRAFEEQWSPML